MKEVDGTKGYELRNTADVQEKQIEKYLNFKLTEQDFADKGKDGGKLAGELNDLEAQFDAVKKQWKEKIDTKQAELDVVLTTIRRGNEDRKVICIEQKDFVGHVVNYIFNGEIMHQRPMEMNERQLELVKSPNVVKIDEKQAMSNHLKRQANADTHAPAPTQEQKDIKDVMREETNRKTKQDLSNRGPTGH